MLARTDWARVVYCLGKEFATSTMVAWVDRDGRVLKKSWRLRVMYLFLSLIYYQHAAQSCHRS